MIWITTAENVQDRCTTGIKDGCKMGMKGIPGRINRLTSWVAM
jgi:hypothetical protein